MQPTTSLRWALYYRALALASFVIGAALAAAGAWIGLYDVVAHAAGLSSAQGSAGEALTGVRPLLGAAMILLGVAIWQVGKTAAFYKTLTEATESQVAGKFDTETVKSEILTVMDERLSEMHTDVEATRRKVDRLGQEDHGDAYDVDDAAGTSSTHAASDPGGNAGSGTGQPERRRSDSRPNR